MDSKLKMKLNSNRELGLELKPFLIQRQALFALYFMAELTTSAIVMIARNLLMYLMNDGILTC